VKAAIRRTDGFPAIAAYLQKPEGGGETPARRQSPLSDSSARARGAATFFP